MHAWDRSRYFDKPKQHSSPGDDASTAEAAPCIVEGETNIQGEVWRANSTPNGGVHLELGRLRLKIWSKPEFIHCSDDRATYLSWHVFICTKHVRIVYQVLWCFLPGILLYTRYTWVHTYRIILVVQSIYSEVYGIYTSTSLIYSMFMLFPAPPLS